MKSNLIYSEPRVYSLRENTLGNFSYTSLRSMTLPRAWYIVDKSRILPEFPTYWITDMDGRIYHIHSDIGL